MGKKKVVEKGAGETAATSKTPTPTVSRSSKKKTAKTAEIGRVYISSSYNNTVITVTDDKGDVMAWATAGALGFAGPKKATPFAASKVVAAITEKIAKTGPQTVDVYVSGVGPGRDSAIRSLANYGFNITSIKDVTPIPHNGPKPKKPRRV
ncbi:MAG: 30S ribosomal protein S11 [Candidatus Colwellbacteria bacterium]|nr:30S ribosomal protein S11 [Candidatus Colwellbacteria bacterium]